MENKNKNVFLEPLHIKKSVDSAEYLEVQKVYVVNQNLGSSNDQFRTSSGLSKLFNISYLELSSDKKALSVVLQQRRMDSGSQSESLKNYLSQAQNSQKQQILKMVQQYKKKNQQNRSKGISVKNRVAKFASETDTKLKLQKLCEQLDGQAFTIFRLGVDQIRDTTVLKQLVISNTFYELCGRNILQETIKMSQTKMLQEFHTKFNYKQQLFCILQWCIKRLEQYGRGQEIEEKHTLIVELDKELIMPDGRIIKTKLNVYNVNPMLYYSIEECVNPVPVESQFSPIQEPKESITYKPASNNQSRSFEISSLFEKQQFAGYKQTNNGKNNIEIITKIYKN